MARRAAPSPDLRTPAALLLATAIPVCAVAIYALLRFPPANRLLTWMYVGIVFAPVVIPPLVLFTVAAFRDPARARRAGLLALALITTIAAAAALNGTLDKSPLREHRAIVFGKEVRPGRFVPRHLLMVRAWGDETLGENRCELAICPALFRSISPGEELRIYTRAGALGIPWVTGFAASPPLGPDSRRAVITGTVGTDR